MGGPQSVLVFSGMGLLGKRPGATPKASARKPAARNMLSQTSVNNTILAGNLDKVTLEAPQVWGAACAKGFPKFRYLIPCNPLLCTPQNARPSMYPVYLAPSWGGAL